MRVLHIVGIQNGWAIANRGKALAAALASRDIESGVWSFKEAGGRLFDSFDFVHVHGLQIVPLVGPALARYAGPWGFEVVSERAMKHANQCKPLTLTAAAVFAKNPRLGDAIRPFVSVEPQYIPNGIDPATFPPRTIRVGWVGNKRDAKHLAYKGVPLIHEAIGRLNAEHAGTVAFEYVEDPSHYPERTVPQSELAVYYRSLDVFVCASIAEGCSNVVLEALASGASVVSTDVGIAHELVAARLPVTIVARTAEGIARGIYHWAKGRAAAATRMQAYQWNGPILSAYVNAYRAAIAAKAAEVAR